MISISERTAIITGATRGIGNAIAVQLAKDGFAVVAVGKSREDDAKSNLDKIREHGRPFIYIRADISNARDRTEIIASAVKNFGRIDVLVNNAGVAPKIRADILETTEESLDTVLGINLKGTFFMSQKAAAVMLGQEPRDDRPRPMIINISSISAYASSTQRPEYCISKSAVSMMTALFADRLAGDGINVYEIRPGIIDTDMTAAVKEKYDALIEKGLTPIKRWGRPQDVADAVSVICSGKLAFSTGETINVDGGFHLRRL